LSLVQCAMSKLYQSIGRFAFVNDMGLCVSGWTPWLRTVSDYLGRAFVHYGWGISHQKVLLVFVGHSWENGKWHYSTARETPANLAVHDARGQGESIPRIEPNKVRHTLGVRLVSGGNSEDKFQYLQLVAKMWKAQMATAHLTHQEASFSLQSSILCKLTYPLVVTTFSQQQQCEAIMWPILMEGLPKVGCLWMMPRVVVHGHLHYVGLNVPNLYTKQFLAQLIMVLWYGRLLDNMTGVLIKATMESMKPETGLLGEFFQTTLTMEPC